MFVNNRPSSLLTLSVMFGLEFLTFVCIGLIRKSFREFFQTLLLNRVPLSISVARFVIGENCELSPSYVNLILPSNVSVIIYFKFKVI